jgi:glycosyltransferase involved in cell wall biosynthesis
LAEKVLIPRICHLNTLITITKDTDSLSTFEKRIDYFAQAEYVVVESERHREILIQSGIAEKKVKLIYPGVRSKPFKKAVDPFRILFATSPMSEHSLLTRGIFLLLHAARKMPEIQFTIVWRGKKCTKLAKAIEDLKIQNIELINGYVSNMDEIYDAVHATILPGITYSSLKPCPHSGLESLAHGKPLLVSYPTSINSIIFRCNCGVVFEPDIQSLVQAIEHLMVNYGWYQGNCHPTIEKYFSEEVFISRYRTLYHSML